MNFPFLEAKARLIRIMGTFDLATGHADTFDELLDSLELELRDVLGHLREASSQHGCAECGINGGHALYCVVCAEKFVGGYKESVPVHASELLTQASTDIPLQRTWVGLTKEEVDSLELPNSPTVFEFVQFIEAKLKGKNP